MNSTCCSCSDLYIKDEVVQAWHCSRETHNTHTQTAAPWINTKPSMVSSYPQVFALWPWVFKPTWLLMCVPANMCVYAPSVLACCVLSDPGSIWLTQAVWIKGLGVFWICFAPPQSSDQGEQMKDTVQWGVNRKNIATTFCLSQFTRLPLMLVLANL